MKAICRATSPLEVDETKLSGRIGPGHRDWHGYDELEVGVEYLVWAVEPQAEGGVWLYLHAVDGHDWPTPYPGRLFEIVDATIPAGWEIDLAHDDGDVKVRRVSFGEWAHDDGFYERLVDGDANALRSYNLQRALI